MAAIFAASTAILLAALAFQYIGGYQPCILCYYQRVPYAVILAGGFIYACAYLWSRCVLQGDGWDDKADLEARRVITMLFIPAAIVFLIGAGLAAYHVGVEWKWWLGPDVCAMPGQSTPDDLNALFNQIMNTPIVHCDEVQWSLFGISMAGYNVLMSLGLAAFSLIAFYRSRKNG
ncbi:MAG: disulfide bond formation protein B [Alphaproteobacteria bacterium]|nr:MAG: disulfide bond formation protein B [Alphaproteobacteria bacterium]